MLPELLPAGVAQLLDGLAEQVITEPGYQLPRQGWADALLGTRQCAFQGKGEQLQFPFPVLEALRPAGATAAHRWRR